MCCDNEIAAVILPPLVGLWMIDVFKNSGEQGDLGGGRRGSLGGGKMRDLGEGRGNLGGKERGDLGGEIFLGYVFWRINFLMWSFLVVYCARYKKNDQNDTQVKTCIHIYKNYAYIPARYMPDLCENSKGEGMKLAILTFSDKFVAQSFFHLHFDKAANLSEPRLYFLSILQYFWRRRTNPKD